MVFLEEGERVLSKKDQSFGKFDIFWPDCSFRTSFRCFCMHLGQNQEEADWNKTNTSPIPSLSEL
jgi:hypothetical protein